METVSVNFLAVIVAALAAWGLGALWYSPLLFAKTWQKEVGLSDEKLKQANMALIFGMTFVIMLIMALGMSFMFHVMEAEKLTWMVGLTHGLYIGIFFAVTATGINYLYQRKSLKLWLIDAGYLVAFLAIMGIIIGAWK